MELSGSCHCGAVRFRVYSPEPYPYQACYCSICRKTAGGGGYAINLGADFPTMEVEGQENVRSFHARVQNPEDEEARESPASRHFCGLCGTAATVSTMKPRMHPLDLKESAAAPRELTTTTRFLQRPLI